VAEFRFAIIFLVLAALVLGILFVAGLVLLVVGLLKKRPALWIPGIVAVALALVGSMGASMLFICG
jgi:hypothetical protein